LESFRLSPNKSIFPDISFCLRIFFLKFLFNPENSCFKSDSGGEVYKNDANFYTDQLEAYRVEAYREVIPEELHYPCKKKVVKQV
jgi:hypothetical protein